MESNQKRLVAPITLGKKELDIQESKPKIHNGMNADCRF